LIDINGICVGGSSAIREYIEEMYPDPKLVGQDPEERSEARRIADFFCSSFHNDAYSDTMKERVLKRFYKGTENKTPDTGKVRASLSKLNAYLGYVSWLVDRRNWLAGQSFSVADIYAASFVSVLDYIGCINWEKHQIVKGWYARIKSRPSFRGVLKDNLSQVPPAKDYSNLDF
jgi:glutathione S-transferase